MGYVPSRKFCCCIPVRFGVFIMAMLGFVGGSIVAGIGWQAATHGNQVHLTSNQEISVVITSLSYTTLAVVSLFGLIGTFTKRQSFVSLYNTLVWYHFGFSLATGAYFIYTLFHTVGDNDVNNCVSSNTSQNSRDECQRAFEVGRGVTIGLYIFLWLIELWTCLIISKYVAQLQEEEAADIPPPALMAASAPPMATTYNYGAQYAFSQTGNAFGERNANKV